MPVYSYRAATRRGEIEEGVIEAADERGVVDRLKDSGLIPLKIQVPRESGRRRLSLRSTSGAVLTFLNELSALLGAGLPIDRSLNIISQVTDDKEMGAVVQAVLKSVREGSTFADALAKHPRYFKRLHVSMIRAGEAGGVLDVVLSRLVGFLEASKEVKDQVVTSMLYPLLLVFTSGLAVVILLGYVIPKFKVIFEDFGKSLPLSTRALLAVSEFLNAYWWVFALLLIAGAYAFWRSIQTEKGRLRWDRFKLKAAGDVVKKLDTARFARTLGTLLGSGVPVLTALGNVKEVVGNTIISRSVDSIARGAKEGRGIAKPMEDSGVFPELAVSMIKVGEETGQMDAMLIKVADTYEKALQTSIKRFMGLLEPVIIIGMGLVIGFIVMSILLAIISVNDIPFG